MMTRICHAALGLAGGSLGRVSGAGVGLGAEEEEGGRGVGEGVTGGVGAKVGEGVTVTEGSTGEVRLQMMTEAEGLAPLKTVGKAGDCSTLASMSTVTPPETVSL